MLDEGESRNEIKPIVVRENREFNKTEMDGDEDRDDRVTPTEYFNRKTVSFHDNILMWPTISFPTDFRSFPPQRLIKRQK